MYASNEEVDGVVIKGSCDRARAGFEQLCLTINILLTGGEDRRAQPTQLLRHHGPRKGGNGCTCTLDTDVSRGGQG